MKLHEYLIQLTIAIVMILVFPIYFATAQTKVVDVEIIDYKFTPSEIKINQGTTIRWINKEKRQYHSVWFKASGEEESDYLFPGDSYEKTFAIKGSFPYRCGPHPEMTGVVHVE